MYGTDVALLVIDLQPDFMPGGALPCQHGDAIVPAIAALLDARDYQLSADAARAETFRSTPP